MEENLYYTNKNIYGIGTLQVSNLITQVNTILSTQTQQVANLGTTTIFSNIAPSSAALTIIQGGGNTYDIIDIYNNDSKNTPLLSILNSVPASTSPVINISGSPFIDASLNITTGSITTKNSIINAGAGIIYGNIIAPAITSGTIITQNNILNVGSGTIYGTIISPAITSGTFTTQNNILNTGSGTIYVGAIFSTTISTRMSNDPAVITT